MPSNTFKKQYMVMNLDRASISIITSNKVKAENALIERSVKWPQYTFGLFELTKVKGIEKVLPRIIDYTIIEERNE